MSKILFDVNIPRPAARLLTKHTVEFSDQRGWRQLVNGELLTVAEQAGFDVFLTADQNLRYQQHLTGRQIGLVILSTNRWPIVRRSGDIIAQAVDRAAPGSYEEVELPRPPLRRRPPSGTTP